MDDLTIGEVADAVHRLVAAVEAGEIEASLDHLAYLRGAEDTLRLLAEQA